MRILLLALVMGLAAFAADATGKWKSVFDTQIGQQSYTYEFKVDGGKLTGKAIHANGSSEIKEGKVVGDVVSFVENFDYQGMEIRIEYKGKFEGDNQINLTRKVGDFAVEEIVATRVKE